MGLSQKPNLAEYQIKYKRSSYRIAVFTHNQTYGIFKCLDRQGFNITRLNASQLVAGRLNPEDFNCFLLADSPHFPFKAKDQLYKFLRNGGDLVLTGGAAFSRPLWHKNDQWLSSAKLENPKEGTKKDFGFHEAFENYEVYEMDRIKEIISYEKNGETNFISQRYNITGKFSGRSAVAADFPGKSEFIPLLEARDQYDRHQGWAGSLLINFSGRYQGSQWALFGIKEDSFYQTEGFRKLLPVILDRFQSEELINKAENMDRDFEKKVDRRETKSKPQRIVIDEKGSGFKYENGTPFFIIGANICGSAGFHHFGASFEPELLEATFSRMSKAGINAVRLRNNGMSGKKEMVQALKKYATKYGIYLLPEVYPKPPKINAQKIQKTGNKVASLYNNHPMLLGYDITNEPYPWDMAQVELEEDVTIGERYPMNYGAYKNWVNPGYFSLFQNLEREMPVPENEKLKNQYHNINKVIDTWLDISFKALREEDSVSPITVGYNNHYIAFPVNERLDFVSNHIYPLNWPRNTRNKLTDYTTTFNGLTTMDRLAAMWPRKPIVVGEFGFSNGTLVGEENKNLGRYTSSVMEMMFYLYSLSKGYSGVMKWMVDDWSMGSIRRSWKMETMEKYKRQARFGLYYYDGTKLGQPKPLVFALRFLSDYVDNGHHNGSIKIRKLENKKLGAGYIYKDTSALFIGDIDYESEALSFKTKNDKPANVMLQWNTERIELMSDNDATVRLNPAFFLQSVGARVADVRGKYGSKRVKGERIEVMVLEGESIYIY